jgi:hypothetical protein
MKPKFRIVTRGDLIEASRKTRTVTDAAYSLGMSYQLFCYHFNKHFFPNKQRKTSI